MSDPILEMIANDPNIHPAFRAAIAPPVFYRARYGRCRQYLSASDATAPSLPGVPPMPADLLDNATRCAIAMELATPQQRHQLLNALITAAFAQGALGMMEVIAAEAKKSMDQQPAKERA